MGLRIGDDETYKLPVHPYAHVQPPPPDRSVSRLKQSLRRKDSTGKSDGRSMKSPGPDFKGMMFQVRSAGHSNQTTNYSSVQCTPRPSTGGRPASEASLSASGSSESDEQARKWWPSKHHRVKHSTSNNSLTSPISLSRSPSADLLNHNKAPGNHRHRPQDSTDMNISNPYNFQHHMHVQPQQFKHMAKKSQNDLIAEFSAMRAAQTATGRCEGPEGSSSPTSYVGMTQSVPASFQTTARSSIHAAEPTSPQSDQGIRYIGSKGSFSTPFRDGKSPRLQQQSSAEFPIMQITDTKLLDSEEPRPDKPGDKTKTLQNEPVCAHCHSRVGSSSTPSESDPPSAHEQAQTSEPQEIASQTGLKTVLFSSFSDQDSGEFKELSAPKPRRVPGRQGAYIHHRPAGPKLPQLDEMRVSMNRSSVNGGLFSSWAADDDSSEEETESSPTTNTASESPKRAPLPNYLQRAINNGKASPAHLPPSLPPPTTPLPSVPEDQSSPSNQGHRCSPTEEKSDGDVSAALEDAAQEADAIEWGFASSQAVSDNQQPLQSRRPSVKNVRFKTEDTLISEPASERQTSDASLDQVQATLDDLRTNISRLEIDLKRQSPDIDDLNAKRPKTAGSEFVQSPPKQRPRASSAPKRPPRPDIPLPLTPNKHTKSASQGSRKGPAIPAVPPLPTLPPTTYKAKKPDRAHERTFSNGSATIPPTVSLPSTIEVQ